jgi:hypothetical protein
MSVKKSVFSYKKKLLNVMFYFDYGSIVQNQTKKSQIQYQTTQHREIYNIYSRIFTK